MYLMQQSRFPPGALGLAAISAHRPLPVGHLRPRRWACRSTCCSAAMCATGSRSMPASTPRPMPPAARDELDRAERGVGLHRLQAQPLPHRHAPQSLGRGRAHRGRIFPHAARDRVAPTTRSPSTRMPRSSSRIRPCSSAMRWRPTTRCSSRSRSGRRTSRPGAT